MLKKFLWWCSGVDIKTLEKSAPADQVKFSSIGASIILTSFLSAISSGYAIYLFSANVFVSLILGFTWGVLVTNLNRLLFSSIRLIKVHFPTNLIYVAFYLCISVLIAISISVPIELKIFQSGLQENVVKKRYDNVQYVTERYNRLIKDRVLRIDSTRAILIKEMSGTGLTGHPGLGPVYRSLQASIDTEENNIQRLRHDEEELKKPILNAPIGFFEQLTAYNELKNQNSSIIIFYYFIRLTLILVECLPILLKFLPNSRLYDKLMDETENPVSPLERQATDETVEANNKGNLFEDYFFKIIADLEFQLNGYKSKSAEMLSYGMIIIFIAILLYIGIAYYLIAVFFETHIFKVQYIYFMISLSLLFIFLQFLGGWFLQQHRSSVKNILYLNAMKPDLNKWIMGYLLIKEVVSETERKEYIRDMLNLLSSNSKGIDNQILTIQEPNFAKDVFDSINELKNAISKINPGAK